MSEQFGFGFGVNQGFDFGGQSGFDFGTAAAGQHSRDEAERRRRHEADEAARRKRKREQEQRERAERKRQERYSEAGRARHTMTWESAHEALGVPVGADKRAIRSAWAKLMRTAHPDCGGDPELAKRYNAAYEQLKGGRR